MRKSSPGSAEPDCRSPARFDAQCRIHVTDPERRAFAEPSHPAFLAKGRVSSGSSASPVGMPHNIPQLMWDYHRTTEKTRQWTKQNTNKGRTDRKSRGFPK